jgi:hypothetical protein
MVDNDFRIEKRMDQKKDKEGRRKKKKENC